MPRTPLSKQQFLPGESGIGFQSQQGVTGGAFGVNVGDATVDLARGIGQAGGVATQIARSEKNASDEKEARELDVEFTRRKREMMYGGPNRDEPGFYTFKGDKAVQAAPDFKQQVDDLRGELNTRASNPAVRNMFDRSSSAKTETEFNSIDRFTLNQEQVARSTAIDARLNEAIEDSTAAWASDDVLFQSEQQVILETHRKGEMEGWEPEVLERELGRNLSTLYAQTITAALKNPDATGNQRARQLLDENASKIDGPVRAELEQLMASQTLLAETQEYVDGLMAVQSLDGTPLSEEEALATARQELSDQPELREQVTKATKTRFNEIDAVRKEEKRAISAEAFNHVWSGGKLSEWAQENPHEFLFLAEDGFLINSLQRAENLVTTGQRFAPVSDATTFNELITQPTEELARTNLEEHRSRLTQVEAGQISRAIDGARDSMDRASKNNAIYDSASQFLSQFAPPEMKWGTRDQGADNRRRQVTITNEMNMFIDSFTRRGTVPTQAEVRAEARRLMTPLESRGRGLIRGARAVADFIVGVDDTFVGEVEQLTPEEKTEFRVLLENVRPAERQAAENEFRKRGIEPTEDILEQFFGAEVLQDAARQRRLLGLSN